MVLGIWYWVSRFIGGTGLLGLKVPQKLVNGVKDEIHVFGSQGISFLESFEPGGVFEKPGIFGLSKQITHLSIQETCNLLGDFDL